MGYGVKDVPPGEQSEREAAAPEQSAFLPLRCWQGAGMKDAFASVPWAPILVLLRDLGQVTPLLGSVSSSVEERLGSPRFPSLDLGVGWPWWPPRSSPPRSGQSASVPPHRQPLRPYPGRGREAARLRRLRAHCGARAGRGPKATLEPPAGGTGADRALNNE